MPPQPKGRPRLSLTSLETRENPAVISDAFDVGSYPYAPTGWNQYASNNQQYYGVVRNSAVSGMQSVAVYGTLGVESRLWNPQTISNDVAVSASIRADAPAPIYVYGRGAQVNTKTDNMVSVAVSKGGSLQLIQTQNGVDKVLQTLAPAQSVTSGWLNVTLQLQGTQAVVLVQRLDTKQFLAADQTWQSQSTPAIQQLVSVDNTVTTGYVGFGRLSGPYGTAYVDDFLATPLDPSKPIIPAHNTSLRLAQLAYAGTPIDSTLKTQVQTSVDLVVSNPSYLGAINQASSSTPQLIYTNISNLYQGLLSDWTLYAYKMGASAESAFYHVSQPTTFSGSSPSSQPVNWFWDVSLNSANNSVTDFTSSSHGGQSGVSFGGSGDNVTIGYVNPFREINVANVKAAQGNWSGVWEYASAGNNGATVWQPLKLVTDTTNNLRNAGQITFDPPSNWADVQLNANAGPLYYVRFRTTAGTAAQAPTAGSILGRDFVSPTTVKGVTTGTIPAFDSSADLNRDGYLSDAEWAARKPGFNARFTYESRLFYPNYGQMRYVTNPSSAIVQAWAADYHQRLLQANPLATGFFLDNANGKLPFAGTPVLESVANYTADSAKIVDTIHRAISPKWILANTSGATTQADGITKAAGAAFEEFLLRPTDVTWSGVGDVVNIINSRLNANGAGNPRPYVVIDSHPGSTSMTDPRTQMGVLSYYYLVSDPADTFLMFYGGYAPAAAWSQKSVTAANVSIGKPTGTMATFATGQDPQNTALTYKVFSRTYDNAIVLFKPRSYTLGKGTGTTDNATATTHALGGNYRVLNADGTLGPVVNSITLRNGEGAVLMKA